MKPTCDPTVFIESQIVDAVIYRTVDGERWLIKGECNRCGDCWKGATNPAPVLDCPVRPEIKAKFPHCTLDGFYLLRAKP